METQIIIEKAVPIDEPFLVALKAMQPGDSFSVPVFTKSQENKIIYHSKALGRKYSCRKRDGYSRIFRLK